MLSWLYLKYWESCSTNYLKAKAHTGGVLKKLLDLEARLMTPGEDEGVMLGIDDAALRQTLNLEVD